MLSDERNRLLTEVGPGTPMGELLRRYWQPIAAVSEFDDKPLKPVRLMGEDLVLYQGSRAAPTAWSTGIARTAAPTSPTASSRNAACAATITAGCSTQTGACLEQPFEDIAHPEARFRDRDPDQGLSGARRKAGLLWAYLGPEPAPLVPNWEPFTWKNGFVQIVFATFPCNWFQCQENSIDPVHFEWMHRNWSVRLRGRNRPLRAAPSQARFRRIRLRLDLSPRPRRHRRERSSYGRSAASACGRTRCSPAITSSGACRSTTRTR